MKTRARRGSSFSQLGLEPNHTGWTAQSLFFLEESCRVKRRGHSNVLKLLQKSSQALKTFFQLLQIKRLQLKLTNTLQNSYQIQSQHQFPRTWVKQGHARVFNLVSFVSSTAFRPVKYRSLCYWGKFSRRGAFRFHSFQFSEVRLPVCSDW